MKKISLMILVLMAVLASCKKTPEVNLKYVDVERDLVTVGTTTATIQCDYNYIATLKKAYLFYGEGQDEVNMISAEMRVVQNTLYLELAGLKANTTYSYYYEFHNGFNSMRTALKTFKTEAGNGGGEEPPTPEITLPTVITAAVTRITTHSARCNGEVTNNGGAEVTGRGVCWGTSVDPTLNDSHIAVGTGTGEFIAAISGLEANTTYHVRAYAINEKGTAYGLDKTFTTLSIGDGSEGVPEGAINGVFTINENGDQVYFSKGNLQYQATTNTWQFANNQYDYVGVDNNNISSTYSGWIDLFAWGTSGWNNGNICYNPWDSSDSANFFGPPGNHDLTGAYANADWGVYNPISNGGNTTNQWRTLSWPEWEFIFKTRSTISGIRYAFAKVNDVNGVVFLPDDWSTNIYNLNNTNSVFASYNDNIISALQWPALENEGAVFLPAAGGWGPENNVVAGEGSYAYYWSVSHSTVFSGYDAWALSFWEYSRYLDYGINPRCQRKSVRLVQDIR